MNLPWYRGADRQARLQDALRRQGYDALLAVTAENAHYLAGHGNYIATHWRIPGLFAVAAGQDGRKAVVSGDFGADPTVEPPYEHLRYTSWTESVDIRHIAGDRTCDRIVDCRPEPINRPAQFDFDQIWANVAGAVRTVAPGATTIGADLREIDPYSLELLLEYLPSVLVEDATHVFDDLRAIKDPDEIGHLRLACELTELGISGAVERLRAGMPGVAVNAAYQIAVHEQVLASERFASFQQAEGLATVGIGADQSHRVEPGQTVKFDMQVDIAGYHSDIGRTYAWEPTREQLDIHQALLAALNQTVRAIRPGITFAEVYHTGAGAMHEQGFTNYSRGHLGHSDGLTQHFEEGPFIAPSETRPIAPSMVLSVELPYYVYGVGAFQLERMVEVSATGTQLIDNLPFELSIEVPR